MADRRCDEIGQFVRSIFQVFQVEYAFGQSSEEPRHSILEHLAPRTEQCSARIQLASKLEEIAFISARPMQKQECARRAARNELVNEVKLRHHDFVGT